MTTQTLSAVEPMPRPSGKEDFPAWLVPARSNIQREMLRLRPLLTVQPYVGTPLWIFDARHLVLGACFSLWRSVFQAQKPFADRYFSKDGPIFLDKLILDNAATYTTELNAWSLQYYIENTVYRLKEARCHAIAAGVDSELLPEAHMIGSPERASEKRDDIFLQSVSFTPYGEWEECLLATRALITAMQVAERQSAQVASGGPP